jgi:Fe(3+) dicitrate transport protein
MSSIVHRVALSIVAAAFSLGAIVVAADGEPVRRDLERVEVEIVTVLGQRDRIDTLPGSHQVIDAGTLSEMHVMTTSEALRKAAGVNVRDEEGFGLRPNIGLRGLNPTRSTKVLLLEDGIPLAYAPYGDNASYYHPPIDRFARIEILKGPAVNLFGPQTIGGVINYITPTPPTEFSGLVSVTGGNRDYTNAHAVVGGYGFQLDVVDKRGDGARDHIDSELNDYNAKWVSELGPAHTLILRANRYEEDSQVTYSGITDAELVRFGYRYNPFHNDVFEADRTGFSLTHDWSLGAKTDLTTNLYYSEFSRDWWRQASTTTDSQCDAVQYDVDGVLLTFTQARAAGFGVNVDDCNSRQGRLRDYESYGVEPRLRVSHALFGADNELTLGARAHTERQKRRQVNATTPTGTTGTLVELNRRDTDAYAAFVQNRVLIDRFEIVPGLRLESVTNERDNALTAASGDADLTEWLPSLGVSYRPSARVTLFAGAHKGFAPPRTEDLIDNSGVVTDVRPEESTNLEIGVRSQLTDTFSVDATAFRTQFDNQIAVGSIAGGSTPLAEGETLYEGIELSAYWSRDAVFGLAWTPYLQLAYTYLPTADIESPFRRVDNGTVIPGADDGNRLPYAPEHLLTTSVGARLPGGVDVHVELVYVDEQFADFANTRSPPVGGNGQLGRIDSYRIWNAAVNWHVPVWPVTVFATAKNLADDDYVVDRTRGIQTAPPRLLQAGIEVRF